LHHLEVALSLLVAYYKIFSILQFAVSNPHWLSHKFLLGETQNIKKSCDVFRWRNNDDVTLTTSYIFDLWSRSSGMARLLDQRGILPRPIPRKWSGIITTIGQTAPFLRN